jgi:Flp pilus assembly protein TadB
LYRSTRSFNKAAIIVWHWQSIMDFIANLFAQPLEASAPVLLLALIAGVGAFVAFLSLLVPQNKKPKNVAATLRDAQAQLKDVQSTLYKAQLDISASEYVKRGLILGAVLGIGLFILVGSVVLLGVGFVAGFMITWTKLEQERDRKQVLYTKQLASACDTMRTAYGVNPSLKKALEAVAEYGQSPVREDFQEILLAVSQERFQEGLQLVAERRRSIVFDTVATSLLRASESTGEVGDMLQRLAESTRQNVGAFEEAVTSQINARSNIQWGAYGPWLIFCVFRVMTFMMSFGAGGNLLGPMASFFSTPAGNVLALLAALISIAVYRYCSQVSQRGLVVGRVSMTEAPVRPGQKPRAGQQPQNALSGQSLPTTVSYGGENA